MITSGSRRPPVVQCVAVWQALGPPNAAVAGSRSPHSHRKVLPPHLGQNHQSKTVILAVLTISRHKLEVDGTDNPVSGAF